MEWVYVFCQVFFFNINNYLPLNNEFLPLSFGCQEGFLQHLMSMFLFSYN